MGGWIGYSIYRSIHHQQRGPGTIFMGDPVEATTNILWHVYDAGWVRLRDRWSGRYYPPTRALLAGLVYYYTNPVCLAIRPGRVPISTLKIGE